MRDMPSGKQTGKHIVIEEPALNKIYLNYPRHVCVVGSSWQDIVNFMPASWNSPISFSPPVIGVAISPERFTFGLVARSKIMSISYFHFNSWEKIDFLGKFSGKDINKVEKLRLRFFNGLKNSAPIPEDAIISFECDVIDMREYGDHHWVVGKILNAYYLPDFAVIDDNIINPRLPYFKPVLYFGRKRYTTIIDRVFTPERK